MENKIIYGYGFSDFIYFYQNNAEKLSDFLTLKKVNAKTYKNNFLKDIELENADEIIFTSIPKILKNEIEHEHNLKIEIIKELKHEY